MRLPLWSCLLLVGACSGDKGSSDTPDAADADTDADSDSDADTDVDTDADADTADTGPPPRDDCPEEERGMLIVTVVATAAPIEATDSVNMIFFPSYPGPPGFFYQADGEGFATLPAPATDTGVPPGYWHTVMACLDRDADHLATCDGPGDQLVVLPDPMTVAVDDVITLDVDFATDTTTPPVFGSPDPTCP